jgi:hypothetical protein
LITYGKVRVHSETVWHGLGRKMEALEKRIEDLVEFRDDFFVRRPSASAAERAAAIREAAMPMIQARTGFFFLFL